MVNKLTIHSGANFTKPNSYNYLENSIMYKHTYIEVDIRVSLDGICFLSHDNEINNIILDTLNFKDIQTLDNDIISLKSAIIFAKKNNTMLNLDIKDDKYIIEVISCISSNNFESSCVISGVHIDGAKTIKKINNNIKILINFENESYNNIDFIIDEYFKINPFGININFLLLENPLFKKLKDTNFEIYTWTVDSLKDYKLCEKNSVFNITTNYPALFI